MSSRSAPAGSAPCTMNMLLPTKGVEHRRRLCIRNTTTRPIAVKVRSSAGSAVVLQDSKVVVGAGKYASLEVRVTCAGGRDACLFVYARPVVEANQADLAAWNRADGLETPAQLAMRVNIHHAPAQYSANDVVVDLPGSAQMVESVAQASRGVDDSDCRTCGVIADDCATAVQADAGQMDAAARLPASAHIPLARSVRDEKCWILGPIMDSLFPAHAAGPAPAGPAPCAIKA